MMFVWKVVFIYCRVGFEQSWGFVGKMESIRVYWVKIVEVEQRVKYGQVGLQFYSLIFFL